MDSFEQLLDDIWRACTQVEFVPTDKNSALARLCGANEANALIRHLDSLDDADLKNDAGDIGDAYGRLRTSLTQVLTEIGEAAVDPLVGALKSPNPETRSCAAEALGRIGNRRAFEPIVALLQDKENDCIKRVLVAALGDIGDERGIEVLLPYLRTGENDGSIAGAAAEGLGNIGGERVIGPLVDLLETHRDWEVRLGALKGFRYVHDSRILGSLRKALNDDDEHVRDEAAAVLRLKGGFRS